MTSNTKVTEELRAQVDGTREQLGRTVAALASKAHVKDRVAGKAATLKGQATTLKGQATSLRGQVRGKAVAPARRQAGRATHLVRSSPVPVAAVTVAVATAAFLVMRRRSRRNR
ncbi:DUF3618 domain-containing protein [Streptomyces johnsoniae]|uniref:DUF3618 domain-containing protein n=1 Tax=Streptomyces johnsoniae TaxID=3075532 RepID=A0ABU2RZR2_9ACTN|nr:DUF3618 domain-containing protein [Streptomyces sp. DSM 41886]MDT0442251.1 DUF3618 domain-containing protein [Streptomyces sp. DSM 41886]